MKLLTNIRIAILGAALILGAPRRAPGQTLHGVQVDELTSWDTMLQTFMDDNTISAGVLAVANTDGTIIYQRSIGVPENALMRVASVEKPITAAAIRTINSDGLIGANDLVFDVDQSGAGLLSITPYDGWGDSCYGDISVAHLLAHRGGFDSAAREPQFNSINISNDLRVVDSSVVDPAGRDNTVRWMLSQPLDYDPGDVNQCTRDGDPDQLCYSNFGYMLIGLIIEKMSGQSNIEYIRDNILTPDMWVPSTEILYGRSFDHDQSPREPHYDGGTNCDSVFPPVGANVDCGYGSWEHEVFRGHGNLVMSAAPLLVFMENYQVAVGGNSGMPLGGANGGGSHTGGVSGTSTIMWQRTDGINIVVLFNKIGSVPNGADEDDFSTGMARLISNWIDDLIASGGSLPEFAVDGFWVEFGAAGSTEVGGFNEPFTSMNSALARTTDGTKLRFKGGSTTWTGIIGEKMRLDAPFDTVHIGAP
jgi:CubicO group peptidase (beta-lactamase class C family)